MLCPVFLTHQTVILFGQADGSPTVHARTKRVRVEQVRLVAAPKQRRHGHRQRLGVPRQVRRVRRQAVLRACEHASWEHTGQQSQM